MSERDWSSRNIPRWALLLMASALLSIAACDAGSPMDMGGPEPPPLPLFQTGNSTYAMTRVPQIGRTYFQEEVGVQFRNRTSLPLYFTRCATIQLVPTLERQVMSDWVDAILTRFPAVGPCTWQTLSPGDTLSFGVSSPPITDAEFQELSGLHPDSIGGYYRMTFQVYGDSVHSATRPDSTSLVDIDLRSSNTFLLTIEEI